MPADVPYGISSAVWPGLGKTMEEMGELLEILGKIIGCGGTLEHKWACPACEERTDFVEGPCLACNSSGYTGSGDLSDDLHDELSDVLAAVTFFVKVNDQIDDRRVWKRAEMKLQRFERWREDGVF